MKELVETPRPAAVEYFTLKEMEANSKWKLAIQDAVEAPAAMAVQFCTHKVRTEKDTKEAEILVLRDNPPPTLLAGQHFEKVNNVRRSKLRRQ